MRGSFTVEATLNFSCVIACLIFFLYMGLYLHDKTLLQSAAVCAAQKGRLYITENQELEHGDTDWERFQKKGLLWRMFAQQGGTEIAEYANSLVEGKLLICETPKFTAEAKADWVKVCYQAGTRLKGVYLSGMGIAIPHISGSVTDSGMEGEEFVRLVKAIMEGKE